MHLCTVEELNSSPFTIAWVDFPQAEKSFQLLDLSRRDLGFWHKSRTQKLKHGQFYFMLGERKWGDEKKINLNLIGYIKG
jgi:hypothetical protein